MNTMIADFLAKAPDPPAFLLTRNAVHILKVSAVSVPTTSTSSRYPLSLFQSQLAQLSVQLYTVWFSCDQVIFFNVFCVFSIKKHVAFKYQTDTHRIIPCMEECWVVIITEIQIVSLLVWLFYVCNKL